MANTTNTINTKQFKENKTKYDGWIRLVFYGIPSIIFLFFICHDPIINHFNISKAESCYNKKDYVCAFKAYREAFATNVDNKKYIGHYVETLEKMKKIAVVQEELNNILVNYPDNIYKTRIEGIFKQIKEETVLPLYNDTYIDDVVQGLNIMHWNNKRGKITVFIDNSQATKIPGYYIEEVQKAFEDYSVMMNNALRFEYINDSTKASINVVFMDRISGGLCKDKDNCADVMGLTENNVTGSLLVKSTVKLRFKDTDNTDFTRNQIYNIAKHEIGHALGVAGHSYNENDIMYPVSNDATWSQYSNTIRIERKEFSKRDEQTFHLLYNIVPDVTDKKYNVTKFPEMFFPIAAIGTKKEIGEKNLAESKRYIDAVDASYISQVSLAEGYFSNRDLDNALDAFKKALAYAATDEEKFTVYNNIAVVLYDKGDYYQAIDYASQANDFSKEELANEIKSYCYIELKKYKEAQSLLEKLSEKYPKNPTYSAALTGVYFKQYKVFSALKELKRIKTENPLIADEPVFRPYSVFLKFL